MTKKYLLKRKTLLNAAYPFEVNLEFDNNVLGLSSVLFYSYYILIKTL